MRSNNYAYVNGRFVPETEATVSIFDRGFLYGDGCFETMRVYGGKIFRLDQHLERLSIGLKRLGIATPTADWHTVLPQLIERNAVRDGVARVTVTRGMGGDGLSSKGVSEPTVVAIASSRDFITQPGALRLIVSSVRLREHSPFEGIKTANRLEYVLAKLEAERAGADDAVLLNEGGWVVELSAANLFAVMAGALFTSSVGEGGLLGITRDIVLELAGQVGIPVQEVGFDAYHLQAADEVFATNSLIEVLPVVELDGKTLPQKTIVQQLHDAYSALVHEELSLR